MQASPNQQESEDSKQPPLITHIDPTTCVTEPAVPLRSQASPDQQQESEEDRSKQPPLIEHIDPTTCLTEPALPLSSQASPDQQKEGEGDSQTVSIEILRYLYQKVFVHASVVVRPLKTSLVF